MSILDARTRSGDILGRNLLHNADPDTEPAVTTSDMAVLLGVPVDDLRAEMARQNTTGTFAVPDLWVQSGRRRVAAATAHGATTVASIVAHLREAS